jgi:hypothetical protein
MIGRLLQAHSLELTVELLHAYQSAMIRATECDAETFSPRTKAMALKVVERMYSVISSESIESEILAEQVILSVHVMSGRNCGSHIALGKMIQLGMKYHVCGDVEMAKFLSDAIRKHQLSRWESVKDMLEERGLKSQMDELLGIYKEEKTVKQQRYDIRKLIPLEIIKNDRPVFKCGNEYVYYTKGVWQLGCDLNREYIRRGFVESGSLQPPEWSQWNFISQKKRQLESLRNKNRPSDSDNHSYREYPSTIDTEPVSTNPLDDWNARIIIPTDPPISDNYLSEINDLKRLVSQLSDRLETLESKSKTSQSSAGDSEVKQTIKSVLPTWEILMSKFFGSSQNPLKPVSSIPKSFDEFRNNELERERVELTRSIVARKLRAIR